MRSALLAVLLIAACNEPDVPRKEYEVDAVSFHRMLQCATRSSGSDSSCNYTRRDSQNIESIRIEAGKNTARYVITWRDRPTRSVVYAEYPGTLIDEIQAAEIPYSVRPSDK